MVTASELYDWHLARREGRQPVTRLTERVRFLRAEARHFRPRAVRASTLSVLRPRREVLRLSAVTKAKVMPSHFIA